jgi:asparagine synthase (glutamine-hydrolysing)
LSPATGIGFHAALEQVILPALRRSPCVVSFSGGRDSSAVLAVATQVARRHGLPDPVPAVMRFPQAPETQETDWQNIVLEHLSIKGAEIVELRHELDALGAIATSALRRLGVHWPANAYMHVPLLELARGGSLLTGVGGDELFGTTASRHVVAARRRGRPGVRDIGSLAVAALPRGVRALVWRARRRLRHPWLTPAGDSFVARALAREEVAWPHRWDAALRYWYRTRAFAGLHHAIAGIAAPHDVAASHPLLDPLVLSELAPAGGATGFPSRSAAMQELFGEWLPAEVLTREAKAAFTGAVWGPAVRAFAHSWDGAGVDERYVDIESLRAQWLSRQPDFRTILLLHTAWLHADGGGAHPSTSSS